MAERKTSHEIKMGLVLKEELRAELRLSQRCELKDLRFYAPVAGLQSELNRLKTKDDINFGIYIGTGISAGEYVVVNGQVNPFKVRQQKCTDGCNCQNLNYKGEKGIQILAEAIKEVAEVENLPNIVVYNTTKRPWIRKMDLASDNLEALLEFELTR